MWWRAALGLIGFAVAVAACGGGSKPINVVFRVGETKTYDASQLPEHSTLVCRVIRQENGRAVPYTSTIDVPAWSSWDPHLTYGWQQSSVVGEIYFGMKSEKHGKLLRVSCAHSPNGLR